MSKSPLLVSGAIIAECLGITRRQHSRLVRDDVLPGPAAGKKYDLAAAVQAFLRYKLGDGGLAAERGRLVAEQRQKISLQNAQKRGELIPIEAVEMTYASAAVVTIKNLEAMPRRLAHLVRDETERRLFLAAAGEEVVRMRNALADAIEEISQFDGKGRDLIEARLKQLMTVED